MVIQTTDSDGRVFELTVNFIPLVVEQESEPHPDGTPKFKIQGQLAVFTKPVERAEK